MAAITPSPEKRDNRKRILLISLIGAIFILLSVIAFSIIRTSTSNGYPTPTPAIASRPDIPMMQVIVASQPIARGSQFLEGAIERQDWPAELVPPDIIADEVETIGMLARQNIAPGQVIRRSMLMLATHWTISSSPAITGGLAYFSRGEGVLFAVDVQTGREIWGFPSGEVPAPPTIVEDTIYVFGRQWSSPFVLPTLILYKVDARTGQVIWRFDEVEIAETSHPISPVVVDDTVYFKSQTMLYAVNADTGSERWRYTAGSEIVSSPAAAEGVVLFTDRNGYFYAVDAASGTELWRNRPSYWYLSAPMMISEGIVYVGRRDGLLRALNTQTDQEIWRFDTGQVTAPPTLVDDILYVIGSSTLYAIDARTGQEIWRFDEVEIVETMKPIPPVVADNLVYFKNEKTLYAIDAAGGRERWRFTADSEIVSPPTAVEGLIYFTDLDGYFYAVTAETGEKQWRVRP